MRLASSIAVVLPLLMASGIPAIAQDAQHEDQTAQTKEPTVRSLSDVRPGVSRAAVLAGLASDYTLAKETDLKGAAGLGLEYWEVVSKAPPLEIATVCFVQGKTLSVSFSLFSSESPDTAGFVDALQSALYNSSDPPTNVEAEAEVRGMASRAGQRLSDAELKEGEHAQMEIWKLNNQRFGVAQIAASQYHSPSGDLRIFSIVIGGRLLLIRLWTMPGGRALVDLNERLAPNPKQP